MESHYEINVSLQGQHYFATAPRSLMNPVTAKAVLTELRKRFPKTDGFVVTMSYWECHGKKVEGADYE